MKKVTLIVALLLGVIMSCTFAQKSVDVAVKKHREGAPLVIKGEKFTGDRTSILSLFGEKQYVVQPSDTNFVKLIALPRGASTDFESVERTENVTIFQKNKKGQWILIDEQLEKIPTTPVKETMVATAVVKNR